MNTAVLDEIEERAAAVRAAETDLAAAMRRARRDGEPIPFRDIAKAAAISVGRAHGIVSAPDGTATHPAGIDAHRWASAASRPEQVRRCMAEAARPGLTRDARVAALTEGSLIAHESAIELEKLVAAASRHRTERKPR
jgi:hypothetical protein